jgi:hypothetical protein
MIMLILLFTVELYNNLYHRWQKADFQNPIANHISYRKQSIPAITHTSWRTTSSNGTTATDEDAQCSDVLFGERVLHSGGEETDASGPYELIDQLLN